MPTVLSARMETNLVPKRSLRQIMREVNRDTGTAIVDGPLRRKFTRQAYVEYPDTVRRRTTKYAERKRRQVGHDIPNVLTGRMREHVPANSRVTATANGGRVYIRNYFPMRESTRQEMEVLNDRDKKRLTKRQEAKFNDLIGRPEYQRKRRIKGSA